MWSHLDWEVEWLEPRLLLAVIQTMSPDVTMSLSLAGSGPASGAKLTIGELGTETLSIAVPQGATPNAQLMITLPQGLALARLDSLTAASGVSASAGSFADILGSATVAPDGSSAALSLGTISNDGESSGTDLISLVFDVVALNVASNQNGALATTTAAMSFTGGSATASASAQIVTPVLDATMSEGPPVPRATDTLTYTIVVAHDPNSGSDAYNVALSDLVPAGLTYVPDSLQVAAGQAPDDLAFSGGAITATYDTFLLGASSTLTFQAQISPDAPTGQPLTNDAVLTYTTLPGSTNPQTAQDNSSAYERTGDPDNPGGALNDLTTSAAASYTPPATPALDDTLVGTNGAALSSPNVTIGAQLLDQATFAIPPGTTPGATLSVSLSPGLAIEDVQSLNYSPDLGTSIPGGFTSVLVAGESAVSAGGGSVLLNLGSLTNSGATAESLTFTFGVVVLNTPGNQSGTALSSQATFSYSGGVVNASAVPVLVATPSLELTEAASPTSGPAGGAPITFTVTLGQSTGSAEPAYNVVLSDVLPAGLTLVPGSLAATAGTAPDVLTVSNGSITATYSVFPVGGTSTLSFQATLSSTLTPGQVVNNPVNAAYATQPGNQTTPVSYYNLLSYPRTGNPDDPGGAVNNLSASATASVTVSGSSLAGLVYVDLNNDGVAEAGEPGLGGVVVTLSGTSTLGAGVSEVTTTSSTGAYLFTGLPAGTYTLTEAVPGNRVAGRDTVGSRGGSNAVAGAFSGIVLGPASSGSGYDFASRATAGLALSATINDATPNVGEVVTYTLTFQNGGPDTATGVTVSAPLPADMFLDSVTPSSGSYDNSSGLWTLNPIADGAAATLVITATVQGPAAQTLAASVNSINQAELSLQGNSTSVRVVPQSAALALSTSFDNTTPNVGATIRLLVTLTNNGPDAATDARVDNTLPAGLSFVSAAAGQGAYSGTTGVWTVGTLAPHASAALSVALKVESASPATVSAAAAADQYDPAPADSSASATEEPEEADLALVSTVSSTSPNVGGTVTDTLKLTDNGPSTATAAVVSATLPPGLTLISAQPSQGTYDKSTGTWQVGIVPDGDFVTLTLIARATAPGAQSIDAQVVRSNQFDPVLTNNTTNRVVSPQEANLKVAESVSDSNPNLGETITVTTSVVNAGPDGATHVVLQSLLPPGLTLVSFVPSQGTYDPATGLWTIGSLPQAGQAQLQLSVRVGTPVPETVQANVLTSDQYNAAPARTRGSASERIQEAVLNLTAAISALSPQVGGRVTYTVNVGNTGPDNATDIVVTVPLPKGLLFSSATSSQGTYDPVTGHWDLGALAAGVDPTLAITAQVASSAPQTMTAAITGVDQYNPNPAVTSESVTMTPFVPVITTGHFETPPPFAPVIGTLVVSASGSNSATASGSGSGSGSGTGNPSGPTNSAGQDTSSAAHGQARSAGSANGTRTAHAHPHPHPTLHPTPHAAGSGALIIPLIPGNAMPALAAVVAAPGAHNNAAAAAAGGGQGAGGLPAQAANAQPKGIPFGSPTPVQDLSVAMAPIETGAVGTTMKVITLIQAQRIWGRGHKSHHHGSRRRFR